MSDPFEKTARAPMEVPDGWTVDEWGHKVEAGEAEREKRERTTSSLERLVQDQLKKENRE